MVGLNSTKVAFFQAFRELIYEKPVSGISVSEIADRARISKATFYRHFRDKYEVMNFHHGEYLESNPIFSGDYREGTCKLLAFFLRHQKYYSAIVKYQGQNSFTESLYDLCFQDLKKRICPQEELMELEIRHYCHGYAALVNDWIAKGCKGSPEQLSQALFNAMPQTIREKVE